MELPTAIDTVVIGAGHAGLVTSWHLARAGREHVVLERRDGPGGSWSERWDSFRLVTPNWTTSFPGRPYAGPDPDGFMPRDEIVARVTGYAAAIDAPVVDHAQVHRLTTLDDRRLRLDTSRGPVTAGRVIVATGSYQVPWVPPPAAGLPGRIAQLHTHEYRRAEQLPSGAVLVVGSGQSGVQIAEELRDAGRTVYLSVGKAGRLPRRYRGRDIFGWLAAVATGGAAHGVGLPTAEALPDPRLRLAGSPQLSGQHGGRDVDLRTMAAAGVTLLGRLAAFRGERAGFADDLAANLAAVDRFFDQQARPMIDTYIERAGIAAPPDDRIRSNGVPPTQAELDLRRAGVSTVIWATGYRPDFGWIEPPIFDEQGFPRHRRGVTEVPGLAFIGLHWQHTLASATLFGPTLDAPEVLAGLWPAAV